MQTAKQVEVASIRCSNDTFRHDAMTKKNSSVALFVMGQKGFAVLRAVVNGFAHLVDIAISTRDPSVRKDYFDEIRDCCREHNIPFATRRQAPTIRSRYAFAVSWRWLLRLEQTVLIVFHDSLLPRYRGFNPLVSCLVNAEPEIGVTALFGADEYDAGDIIEQASTSITYPIKIQEAIDLIADNYARVATNLIGSIDKNDTIQGRPQNERDATYSLWRDDRDYCIDWTQSAPYIARFVDAVGYPYSGALTHVNGCPARLLEAQAVQDVVIENRVPGKVVLIKDGYPIVVCGEGLLRVDKLVAEQSGESLLPLKRFRTRFTGASQ